MFNKVSLVLLATIAVSLGQQIGTQLAETHPALTIQQCAAGGSCTNQARSVVLDSNWRWTHKVNTTTNCYTGNTWDTSICTSPTVCAQQCALDGADYPGTYGVTASGSSLTLKFVTQSQQKNVGSRLYLMQNNTNYQLFNLLGQEFSFDVDLSTLPCGLNGAVYFVEMDSDGGKSRFSTNAAGATYGTGYCDSQCPRDIKFINGLANTVGWTPDTNNNNTGKGSMGTCCTEMDIWEANSMATAVTPHACSASVNGQTSCTGNACGASAGTAQRYSGVCDPDGCDFNSFRMGNKGFIGPGLTVDTRQKMTVVTQFITNDGTTSGSLSEIRRFYVQNGVIHANSFATFSGLTQYNSISDGFCNAQKAAFGDTNSFEAQGGMARMTAAWKKGMVLVLSLWDDYAVNMLWLDSNYPTTGNPATPGIARGNCSTTSGVPATVEGQSPNAQVIYSNIKYGPINSTFGH